MSDVLKGQKGVVAKLDSYRGKMSTEIAKAMIIVANKVLNESAKLVPVDTGELMSRGFTEGPYHDENSDTWMVVVGYEKTEGIDRKRSIEAGAIEKESSKAPYGNKNKKAAGTHYAAAVHENETYSFKEDGIARSIYSHKAKKGGYTQRRSKYLEIPWNNEASRFLSDVAAVAKKVKP